MRIIKDGLGNVYRNGETIHTRVRILQDDQQRVAVYAGKSRTDPPLAVYAAGEVTFDRSGGCSTCQGWPHQSAMKRNWELHDRKTANV